MFFIVGIGLKPEHISLEALSVLKGCQKIYLEDYTSQYSQAAVSDLEKLVGKQVLPLSRKDIEEGFQPVLEESRSFDVCLAVYGNPLDATTHIQLLLDASEKSVEVKIIPSLGIFDFVSACGLERYKFGRATSIVFRSEDYEPESFYDAILDNKKIGLHTLCLLDIRKEEGKLMGIRHALSILESIEEKREKAVLSDSLLVGLAGVSSNGEQVKAGTIEQLKLCDFTEYPQSLIVCGKLNEKEIEALRKLADLK